MTRIIAYVDGFNMYHAVNDFVAHPKKKLRLRHNKVNLWALVVDRKRDSEELIAVNYFSAYANWLPRKARSHRLYVKNLEAAGVTAVMSHFKEKPRHCKYCNTRWTAHEEKETDVRIALRIYADAAANRFDRAYILSADSDLVPAIEAVKNDFPEKKFSVLTPPGRNDAARDLKRIADASDGLMPIHIRRNLF